MSSHAIERAFWRANTNAADLKQLAESPANYLDQFQMTPEEKRLVRDWDVNGIIALGVNPMLVMMAFQGANGRHRRAEYRAKVNGTWTPD
jgi:hypothetical protein